MILTDTKEFIKDSIAKIPEDFVISETNWKFSVRSVARGRNLLLLGDSGCGKTRLAYEMQKLFDRPFYKINMGGAQDARSTLIGNTHYAPDRGTYVSNSYFVQAIQTENAIILLDELSRANNDALNILMTVLDYDQRYLRIDESPDSPTVKVASGVTFVMTANVGAEYTATRVLDRAIIDRSTILLIPNLTAAQEVSLLGKLFPEINEFWIKAIAGIAEETRIAVLKEDTTIDTIISTRNTIEICHLLMDGFNFLEAAEAYIYPLFSNSGGGNSPRTTIIQKIQRVYKPGEPILKKDIVPINPYAPVVPTPAPTINTTNRPWRNVS